MPARLAQHLVQRGLLPERTLEDAQRRRATHGGSLDSALLELGVIAEPGMLQALADVSGLKPVNLADFEPNAEMARYVPANVAERLGAVPLSVDGNTLHVATAYPPSRTDLEEVAILLGKKLEPWIAIEARVRDWISAVYGTELSPRFGQLLHALDPTRAPPPPPPAPPTPAAVTTPEAAPNPSASSAIAVVEPTLEDALTREMVEQIARAVAEEPILLEVRKKKPATAAASASASAAREETRPVDLSALARQQAPAEAQPTRQYDLTELAAKTRPAPAPQPATWERQETVAVDVSKYQALRTEAARAQPAAPPPAPTHAAAQSSIAPVIPPPPPAGPPSLVVFPNPAAPAAPATSPIAAPAPVPMAAIPLASGGPEWTLQQARAALKDASQDRERIIQVALTFARRTFEFAAAFAVVRGSATGWAAEGDGAEAFRQTPPSIPLDTPSVFRTVAMTRGSYVGPVPPDALTSQYLHAMGRAPRMVFLFPVEVKNRLVVLLYGDPGARPISQRKLSDLLLFCQDLPAALQELILFRKQKFGASQAAALGLEEMIPKAAASMSMGWSPSVSGGQGALGRVAGLASMIEDPTRPPPDFTPILRKLTGWDASARAAAIAELARTPNASAKALTETFPGPTAWSRLPVAELPEADELGPIPSALARLGRPAAQALAPLLDADDPDVRYFALLTAGSLPFPELVGGVLRGLFDFEPDISSAARAAAAALRRLPRFADAMRNLRQELASVDTLRRSLAARALGVLHDRESVEGLINLTASDDELCAQAATEALREITKASFGPDQRRWTAWWAENRTRSRSDWLVAALRHPEVDVRLSAIEELSKHLNDNLGYFADAPVDAREPAVRKWEAALMQNPRLRRLE